MCKLLIKGVMLVLGGDAETLLVRDFDKKPLDNVPSAYKPTKVNIDELRKQKSDTTSSTPKTFKSEPQEEKNDDDGQSNLYRKG